MKKKIPPSCKSSVTQLPLTVVRLVSVAARDVFAHLVQVVDTSAQSTRLTARRSEGKKILFNENSRTARGVEKYRPDLEL